ncbi:AHH domain-containing protein [Myxococcus sp. RHSTA-1-4]|uniref:AHH domain-containing protein n=1 Tax=Myxococcus sp. RHSTA-1-4 TaxID=2874601 RepID=UPI001CBC3F12|nr:AHH domain-containing protein [Myxococcus sp. RHSTA-1-4]MBZ4417485.1 AHH domain-containing protein [Myxococcus sp. RHSTA-1-4]
MSRPGRGRGNGPVTLQGLVQGPFELYGKPVSDGRPNLRDFGSTPRGTGEMKRNEPRRKQVKETRKNRKRDDGSREAAPHVDPGNPKRAILAKGSSYARNGAAYIRGTRPSEYSTFPHLGPAAFQADVQSRASISQPSNFNPELTGQSLPYPWRAHHLIPGEAFYTEDSEGELIFDKEENFDIVLQTPYDIDHGHNLILLPSLAWAVPVHALMQHPNNHNGYTKDVMHRMKSIDNQVDTLRGKRLEHAAIVANVFEELKSLESDLWDELLDESRAAVRGAAEGRLHDGPWCRWKTQEGREYVWPSLW